jgi:Icc-related predicted phosphoesterase
MLTKEQLQNKIAAGLRFLDGATGSNLQKAGMPKGCCTEKWVLENPEILQNLQRTYTAAGSQILYAPTFQAQPIALERVGLADQTEEINARLVALSRSAAPDALVAGDLTTLGGVAAARHVIEAIEAVHPVVFAQIGNMDRPEVNDWLEARGINLHRKVRKLLPNVALLGVGGSTFSPFGTPSEFPEARFSEWLEELALRAGSTQHIVLAAHNPPYNTACDRTSNGIHVGSSAVRDFIEEHQPAICLCGHIHESVGIERLGRTIVANPGPFSAGCYALLTAAPSGLSVSLKRLER